MTAAPAHQSASHHPLIRVPAATLTGWPHCCGSSTFRTPWQSNVMYIWLIYPDWASQRSLTHAPLTQFINLLCCALLQGLREQVFAPVLPAVQPTVPEAPHERGANANCCCCCCATPCLFAPPCHILHAASSSPDHKHWGGTRGDLYLYLWIWI